jgi:hypothetical protein
MKGAISPCDASKRHNVTAFLQRTPLASLDWVWWLLADLVRWGLPWAGVALGSVVARRWGWRALVTTTIVLGAAGVVLLAVPATVDLSLADAVGIAVWFFVVPWLLGGSVTLVIRHRRGRQRIADQR